MLDPFNEIQPDFTHAGNIPLQLLWSTSDQREGPPVGLGMLIYLFYQSLAGTELITNIYKSFLDVSVE